MGNIQKAVILAAGMGTRLGEKSYGKPKGFLELGDRPIIIQSIEMLISHGIEQIALVSGYQAEMYQILAEQYHQLTIIHNPAFAESGSAYSLSCAREFCADETYLLLESDLIYEPRAIRSLLEFDRGNAILTSGFTHSGDEVYIEARGNTFLKMSKQRTALGNVVGELVGISKIDSEMFVRMLRFADDHFKTDLRLEYENCINVAAREMKVLICKVDDLLWAEIDDAQHLLRAQQDIYPKIQNLERSNHVN